MRTAAPLPTPTVEPPMRVHTFTFDYIGLHSAVFHNRDMKQNCLESRLRGHRIGGRERKRRTTQEENHGQLATGRACARSPTSKRCTTTTARDENGMGSARRPRNNKTPERFARNRWKLINGWDTACTVIWRQTGRAHRKCKTGKYRTGRKCSGVLCTGGS